MYYAECHCKSFQCLQTKMFVIKISKYYNGTAKHRYYLIIEHKHILNTPIVNGYIYELTLVTKQVL